MTFYLSYIGWIFYIAYAGGFWVYPILEYLDAGQRALFIALCAVVAIGLYLVGEVCNKIVWGNQFIVSEDLKSSHQPVFTNQDSKRKRTAKNKQKYY